MRENLLIFAYFYLLLIKASGVQLDFQGPVFSGEPPRRVEFSNTVGGKVDCQARGVPLPVLEWVHPDGTSVTQITDLRIVHRNGSLVFPSFSAERFRHDVHAALYRCIAKNQVGVILSREILVKAVVNQKYDVQVSDEYVIAGNTAVLRCQVPSYLSDYILVTSWTQDDTMHIYPMADTGGKYAVFKTGELFIFNIGPSDAYKSYFCRTVNKLTGKAQSNAYPARIVLTEVKEKVRPRLGVEKQSTINVKLEDDVLLRCLSQGYPVPTYRWFKQENEKPVPVEFNERITEIANGLVIHIDKVKIQDEGKYICLTNNSAGQESIYVDLIVVVPLSVNVQPQNQIIDVNKEAIFFCIVGGSPISSVMWFHDGKIILEDDRHQFQNDSQKLLIKFVQKNDFGMYQCFASNDWDTVQSSAELQLGDASPELLNWFTEQTLQPGPSISLKCSATGNPPPHFSWTLDGFPVPDNSRFMIGQYITINDDVITHLNISGTQEEDGGEYTCTAKNSISQVSHSARINIYGRPFIRHMPKINAIAGTDLQIKCPVAGYPIESITWEKNKISLPVNRRQKVFSTGTLIIEKVQKQFDEGIYTCQAKNNQKLSDRGDVEVYVMVPPKILPIQEIVLREGMRAAITCQCIEGDLPFKFHWEKNGEPITGPKPLIRRVDEYTSLLVIDNISALHAGNYVCFVENIAGVKFFTVPLTVNVPPKWQIEPADANVIAGFDVVIDCQATGSPKPTIVWKKSIGLLPGEYKEFLYESNINFYPNGSMQITKASKENEGHYLCEAKNEVGSEVSKLIYLKVNVQARFLQKFKQMQVVKGREAYLQCTAIGEEPIKIKWRFNGEKIKEEKGRYTIKEQSLDEGLASELSISETYRQDTGVFTCHGSNYFGEDETQIQLVVQEIPESPTNIRISDQKSRSLQLAWTQPYAGNSPIINYVVEMKKLADDWKTDANRVIVPGTKSSTIILDLQPAHSYVFRIFAENKLGKSEPSESIQVTTQEEAPTGAPLNVKAEPKSSTEIRVVWEPPPKSRLNGKLLGYYVGYQVQTSIKISQNASFASTGYTFKTVQAEAKEGENIVIKELNKFTSYSIIVQAFNSKGAGPFSTPIIIRTQEDVPTSPPKQIYCHPTSSQSIEVGWEPPNVEEHHGILQGYKISYKPKEEFSFNEEMETKVTTLTKTIISGLLKYTNYSVTLLSFTSVGDGAISNPIFCRTDEDVPSPPKDIKAAFSSNSKIMVVWLPPKHKNGQLICFTIYMSLLENGKEEGTHKRILSPDSEFYETVRHQGKEATYQFWITASTKIGEGESSRVVTVSPSNNVPAKIMSFGRDIITPWKETLNLTCRRVGVPFPQPVWRFNQDILERNEGRRQIYKNGSLILKGVQKADEGNYICSVENFYGKDEIVYNIVVKVPPDRPKVSIVSTTSNSLQLEWSPENDIENEILGYVINYKRDYGDWEELQLEGKLKSYSLNNLWCATRYQLYVTAYNKVGMGLPCDIVTTFTMGSIPVEPKENNIIKVNSTTASIWLDSWHDGGCPINYFIIDYQISKPPSMWYLASNSVKPSDREFVFSDLKPGTTYNVKVTAHNNAGSSTALYKFATLTMSGALPKEESDISKSEDVPYYFNQIKIIMLFLMGFILCFICVAIVIFIWKRNGMRRNLSNLRESTCDIQMKNEQQNQEHHYQSIEESKKFSSIRENFPGKDDDYNSEICPYTAFKIFKPPYSENSYSGNINFGAYNPVKNSFPFRDFKPDLYKAKSKENSGLKKFPKKNPKPKGKQIESQESENFGSTDSEVKKILSMHLPLSEYDTLGSDSDGETGFRTESLAPEYLPFKRSQRSGKRVSNPKNAGDESSSSSETLQKESNFSMKKSRSQGQSKRRQMKDIEGFLNHAEEVTFSSHPTLKMSGIQARAEIGLRNLKDKSGGRQNPALKGIVSSKIDEETSFQISV